VQGASNELFTFRVLVIVAVLNAVWCCGGGEVTSRSKGTGELWNLYLVD
jgi:hypothetical protein